MKVISKNNLSLLLNDLKTRLNGKLDKTATAADSALFDGKPSSYYSALNITAVSNDPGAGSNLATDAIVLVYS
jgi:hypothetical protein